MTRIHLTRETTSPLPFGNGLVNTVDREQTRAIRDWARDNGWALSERGRIPATVTTAFDEAHAAPKRGRKGK